jgi:enoyl-CoA hydratase
MPETEPKQHPVLCHRDTDGVAVVTIDRPERRNALNLEVKSRIAEVVSQLVADGTVRVIVLTGSGGYFVAGTDIAEMATMTPTQHVTLGTDHVFNVMHHCPKPLIAALEGYASDAPLETALALERKAFVTLFGSIDQKEGTNAFLEKRKPKFIGC